MGSTQVIKGNGLLGLEAFERPYYRRLGLINGFLIAQGEVVVVNDKLGIRLTDIITPAERLRRLNR